MRFQKTGKRSTLGFNGGMKLSSAAYWVLNLSLPCPFAELLPAVYSSLVRLTLSLSVSYPYLIKFHDFADNSQESMKHQIRGATQAQQGMTLQITLISQLLLMTGPILLDSISSVL
jgi:hypothetical protein